LNKVAASSGEKFYPKKVKEKKRKEKKERKIEICNIKNSHCESERVRV
jgi:hypothetical protein